jgi:Flp pilus assembly protein TadG
MGKQRKDEGQAFVEFALTLTLFLLLVLGILEVGRLLFYYSAITTAAREGARYGSAAGGLGGSQNYYEDCAGIIGAATRVGQFAGVRAWDVQIQYDDGNNNLKGTCGAPSSDIVLGDRIIVTVNGDYEPFAGLVPIPPFTISSVERRTIVKDVEVR